MYVGDNEVWLFAAVLQHLAVKIPVLNRLGDVVVADRFGIVEGGQRLRAETHSIYRVLQERLCTRRERAELARRRAHTAHAYHTSRRAAAVQRDVRGRKCDRVRAGVCDRVRDRARVGQRSGWCEDRNRWRRVVHGEGHAGPGCRRGVTGVVVRGAGGNRDAERAVAGNAVHRDRACRAACAGFRLIIVCGRSVSIRRGFRFRVRELQILCAGLLTIEQRKPQLFAEGRAGLEGLAKIVFLQRV